MSKWLVHFLQKTCQTSTDKTDTTLEMRDVSVMSVSEPSTFEKNKLFSTDTSVMSVGTLDIIGDQKIIDLSPYIDFYNEGAAIYEFEARDV